MTPPADAPGDAVLSPPRRLVDSFRPLDRFDVTVPGEERPIERDVLRGGRVIALLAVDLPRDRLVMLRQFRPGAALATGTGDLVEVVAGRVEKGEDLVEAVRREAMEEIGIAVGEPVPVLDFLSSPGISDEFATLFVAAADSAGLPSNAGAAHEREMTRPFAVTIDAALAALTANTVRSGYTLLALQWLALNRARLAGLIG